MVCQCMKTENHSQCFPSHGRLVTHGRSPYLGKSGQQPQIRSPMGTLVSQQFLLKGMNCGTPSAAPKASWNPSFGSTQMMCANCVWTSMSHEAAIPVMSISTVQGTYSTVCMRKMTKKSMIHLSMKATQMMVIGTHLCGTLTWKSLRPEALQDPCR